MAKKHKHPEHINLEAWVVSFADMMTLLFALFVVLYSLGEIKLKKLRDVKAAIAFAFHFEGEGKTQDDGIFDSGTGGGEIFEGMEMITAQKGPMKEFLMETLPDQFEEMTGSSLEIVVADDTISFSAPLSSMFTGLSLTVRNDLKDDFLSKLFGTISQLASEYRVRIDAPKVIGVRTRSDGKRLTSAYVCHRRLDAVLEFLWTNAGVDVTDVTTEFKLMKERATLAQWQEKGKITFAFSNN